MEALIAYSHVKLHSCGHTNRQFSLDWSHIPIAGFHRLDSTKYSDHLSEDDTFSLTHLLTV